MVVIEHNLDADAKQQTILLILVRKVETKAELSLQKEHRRKLRRILYPIQVNMCQNI